MYCRVRSGHARDLRLHSGLNRGKSRCAAVLEQAIIVYESDISTLSSVRKLSCSAAPAPAITCGIQWSAAHRLVCIIPNPSLQSSSRQISERVVAYRTLQHATSCDCDAFLFPYHRSEAQRWTIALGGAISEPVGRDATVITEPAADYQPPRTRRRGRHMQYMAQRHTNTEQTSDAGA
jgi:hypothetical protein